MIIGISGTPGTGKTTVAKELSQKLKYSLIDLNELIKKEEIYDGYDEKRNSFIVDEEKLNNFLKKQVKGRKNSIIEGHLAHHLDFLDLLIILRTNPEELRKRLEGRGWNKSKIIENVHAEIIDVILQESVYKKRNICEIDTTKKNLNEIVLKIVELIKDEGKRESYRAGRVNWTGFMAVE